MNTIKHLKTKFQIKVDQTGDAFRDLVARYNFLLDFFMQIGNVLMVGEKNPQESRQHRKVFLDAIKKNINAVVGVEKKYRVNYRDVAISFGSLPAPIPLSVEFLSKKLVLITWENQPHEYADKNRLVYVLQYNASKKDSFIWYYNCEVEDDCAEFRFEENQYGDEVHFWVFFMTMDGKQKSNSTYIGQIRPLSN